jgi:hypothetical protein
MPMSFFEKMPEVHVTYSNGVKEMLFSYYPDEIFFKKEEFLGLTRGQAMELFHKKDVSYLRN